MNLTVMITTERLQNALDKQKRLEDALLEYIEKHKKNPPPEIAATIPAVAEVLVKLLKD